MDFESIDRSVLSEEDDLLLGEVENIFESIRQIEALNGQSFEISKCYFVFAYNLLRMGLYTAGTEMMEYIQREYYTEQLRSDLDEAMAFWQEAEDLKNQIAPDKVARRKFCHEQAELVEVTLGMVKGLQFMGKFQGDVEFFAFIDSVKNEEWVINRTPSIGLAPT